MRGALILNDSIVCQFLAWDSEFFETAIARFIPYTLNVELLELAFAWCRDENIQCLYYLADPNDYRSILLASSHQFIPVDIRLTFLRRSLNDIPEVKFNNRVKTRTGEFGDLPVLRQIVQNNNWPSRFYFDPHFKRDRVNQFYVTWLENCFIHSLANSILVAEKNDKVVGFIICDMEGEQGKISLVGVDLNVSGLGIGPQLVYAAIDYFKEHNGTEVQVATQGRNIPAQRLYQKCGFITQSIYMWYHKWFQNNL